MLVGDGEEADSSVSAAAVVVATATDGSSMSMAVGVRSPRWDTDDDDVATRRFGRLHENASA